MKKEERTFKVMHNDLEQERPNIAEQDLLTYLDYIHSATIEKTEEEIAETEIRNAINLEIRNKKIKLINDVVEQGSPGFKFKKFIEDMKKKLRVDEKISSDYGLKVEAKKLDENQMLDEKDDNFTGLGEEDDKAKFRLLYKNAFHHILVNFFNMFISLKKAKREYAVVFRFFGNEDRAYKQFCFEWSSFCKGTHPRYSGSYGFGPQKFDGKGNRDMRVFDKETLDNICISYGNKAPEKETYVFCVDER